MQTLPVEVVSMIAQELLPRDLTRFLATTQWIRMSVPERLHSLVRWYSKAYPSRAHINTMKYCVGYGMYFGGITNVSTYFDEHKNRIIFYNSNPDSLHYDSLDLRDTGKRYCITHSWIGNHPPEPFDYPLWCAYHCLTAFNITRDANILQIPRTIMRRIVSYLNDREAFNFLTSCVGLTENIDSFVVPQAIKKYSPKGISSAYARRFLEDYEDDETLSTL